MVSQRVERKKKPDNPTFGFRVVSCLDGEAWFRIKISLKLEIVPDEADAFSEFRRVDSKKLKECILKALEKFPFNFIIEY